MPSVLEILFKPLLIITALYGVYLQAKLDGGFFRTNVYLYFTIFSNTGTAIVFAVMFIAELTERIRGRYMIPQGLFVLKFMFTAALAITLVVAATLLAPFKDQAYLFSAKNLTVHIFAPLIAVLDFLIFDRRFIVRWYTAFLGLAMPAGYSALTLLLSIRGIHYSNGTIYPYYFFNWRELGWWTFSKPKLGVGWWLIIIGVAALIISAMLTAVKYIINSKGRKRKNAGIRNNRQRKTI